MILASQIPREHSKVHVLKKNRTLQQIIFLRISRYYIKTKDLFYQLITLFFKKVGQKVTSILLKFMQNLGGL